MIRVGASSRIDSPFSSWPFWVTSGRSWISAYWEEVSRPTMFAPSPRSKTIREVEP